MIKRFCDFCNTEIEKPELLSVHRGSIILTNNECCEKCYKIKIEQIKRVLLL